MKSIWKAATKVALFEYRRNVFKKSFILLLISVPVFIILSIGMGVFIESTEDNPLPVGIVDCAGVFENMIRLPVNHSSGIITRNKSVEFFFYRVEEEASSALKNGEIQAYYLLPNDYHQTRRVEQVYIEKPGVNAKRQFYDFLQLNLLSAYPAEVANRTALGTDVTVRSMDGKRVIPSGGPTFGLLMPLFGTMAILFMILISSGYTMSAVADEKENRLIEVLATSTSMDRLITGKILGTIAIGLTLLITWIFVIIVGVLVARQLGVGWFQDLSMDWRVILAALVIGIPAYALVIALMTAVGAMVTTTQEGQSISSIFIILHLVPFYVSLVFLKNPHNPLSVTLSLSPFTALMAIALRNLFTTVPSWQIIISVIVQITCFLGALWLAGRSLRLGMLRYGQRLTWRSLINPVDKHGEI